jgi:hypothetical protein
LYLVKVWTMIKKFGLIERSQTTPPTKYLLRLLKLS